VQICFFKHLLLTITCCSYKLFHNGFFGFHFAQEIPASACPTAIGVSLVYLIFWLPESCPYTCSRIRLRSDESCKCTVCKTAAAVRVHLLSSWSTALYSRTRCQFIDYVAGSAPCRSPSTVTCRRAALLTQV